MAEPPRLQVGNLPPPTAEEKATVSPARGRETRIDLLGKLRPPPLVHAWEFWHEKPPASHSTMPSDNAAASQTSTTASSTTSYNTNLTVLHSVTDIRTFWTLFNNFSFSRIPPRHSVHLFHKSVTPVWEDPRNARGGAWIFRLSASAASTFFRSLALLAIGEQLQEAISDETKLTFRDDICGISYSVKSERTTNVSVWNRDASHEVGLRNLLQTILDGVEPDVRPREGTYYYKKHKDHAAFSADESKDTKVGLESVPATVVAESASTTEFAPTSLDSSVKEESKAEVEAELEEAKAKNKEVSANLATMEAEMEKMRKMLAEVNAINDEMAAKVDVAAKNEEAKVAETSESLEGGATST